MRQFRLGWILPVILALPAVASAETLSVVNVNYTGVTCTFDTSCTIGVSDSTAAIPLPGIVGTAQLQSRTFVGGASSPAAGYRGYEYRVDLTGATGLTAIPCVTSVRVAFGAVTPFQYDGVGAADQVFVITSGGIGTIGLSSAVKSGNDITFTFASPVCAGSSPGTGATSYFFGLASQHAPIAVTANVTQTLGGALSVAARAPGHDKCATGAALAGADTCVADICAADPYCCTTAWDATCVAEVRTICDSLSCAEADGTCSHSLCDGGAALVNTCDSTKANCVAAVCAADAYCCTTAWDSLCVSEVDSVCGNNCD